MGASFFYVEEKELCFKADGNWRVFSPCQCDSCWPDRMKRLAALDALAIAKRVMPYHIERR